MWLKDIYNDPLGRCIWIFPACLVRVAVDEIYKGKQIVPGSSHIFVYPVVTTSYWRKSLGKITDTMSTLKVGYCVWNSSMLEPLMIAFVKPLFSSAPWKVGQLLGRVDLEWKMSRVQWKNPADIQS